MRRPPYGLVVRARTFLSECYVPKLDEAAASALSSRLQATIADLTADGLALRWLRGLALLDEETYVWMVSAPDADHVVLVNRRAGIAYDHVVEVVAAESV